MTTPLRFSLAPTAGPAGSRVGTRMALPVGRAPVLVAHGAPRQLELPFTAPPAAPRHSLRTG